ncbi:MAG: bifunctional DNA-formamidopyrimidine glycosylase/DNA-(apurinic or apyrimidinic site) lyase [Anaerolineae bacterium]|nr:MAG: bifunctional DNA-formamidopyrimidine glycosylase/DNA-(apurinic or apyrimidinic site) lyase [Anaerolineae bacterium]
MPELPEVETIVRNLRPAVVGRTILAADLRWERTLAAPTPALFLQRVRGRRIEALTRRGKYIRFHLDRGSLFVHLRMSGDLCIKRADYAPQKHDRLLLALSPLPTGGGEVLLVFQDARKFGRVRLTENPAEVIGHLGPEPLDEAFTPHVFYRMLQSHRGALKPLLLNQRFLAGLGNIYTDEALHMAGLHPLQPANSLSEEQAHSLWNAIRQVLRKGIQLNGATIDWVYRGGGFQNHFAVYRRKGQPCPRCGETIRRIIVAQRGTYFCPSCQAPRR